VSGYGGGLHPAGGAELADDVAGVHRAVFGLMYNSAPIWALMRPAAAARSTVSSRPVSPYGAGPRQRPLQACMTVCDGLVS
jgi:hypothetical protein